MKYSVFFIFLFVFIANISIAQYSVFKMPYPVNTDVYDEICPILSFDEDELYFTRVGSPDFDKTIMEHGENLYETEPYGKYLSKLQEIYRMLTKQYDVDPVTSSFNQDVWYSHFHEGEIYNLFHPPHPLNNALPNSICSHYGKNGSYVVINQFGEEGGVSAGFSVINKTDNEFSFPEPIIIQDFNKIGSDVNLSMSIDKEYMILAIKNSNNRGDKDLYLSIKGYKGVYSTPVHLGNVLNSEYREATPFFSQKKKKLYFASDRPGGYGGMDIYVSDRLDYSFKKWSKPKLLGRPINSEFNDSHPYVQVDENSILFTSNREGTSDIFYGKLNRDENLLHSISINVFIVKGEDRKRANAQLYWGEAYSDEWEDFFRARDGKYTYTFEKNISMQFKAKNRGYISDLVMLDPQELQEAGIRELDLELVLKKGKNREVIFKRLVYNEDSKIEKVEPAKEDISRVADDLMHLEAKSTMVLKNILFEMGKPDVLPVSFSSLLKLGETLARRPDLVIQVEGHTDNNGDSKSLLDLSLDRASSIRDFLLLNGAESKQVKTKGFGATRPITKNRNEEERSENRRVEIRVLRQGE